MTPRYKLKIDEDYIMKYTSEWIDHSVQTRGEMEVIDVYLEYFFIVHTILNNSKLQDGVQQRFIIVFDNTFSSLPYCIPTLVPCIFALHI